MKHRSLLLGLILTVLGFTSQGQIHEVFHQGFEAGEPQNYTVQSGTVATQTALYSGGSHALKFSHTQTNAVVMLDTIDFTTNATWQHYSLEFMHICNVNPLDCDDGTLVAVIHVKPTNATTWIKLGASYYNTTESSASDVETSFHNRSYDEWNTNAPNNTMWKKERFDFDNLFAGAGTPVSQRKLQVRLTLYKKSTAGTSTKAWYMDDISIKASSMDMVKPTLSMLSFPDLQRHASSRGAYISAKIQTTVAQGMEQDSIYVEYKVGNRPTTYRQALPSIAGQANCYGVRIPFYGYDTIMQFRVVAKDATTNHNTVTYPRNSSSWVKYYCVRGQANTGQIGTGTNTATMLPFPYFADNQSEFVYDSVKMAEAGFKPGAITKMTFVLGANSRMAHRDRVRIQMRNAANLYTTPSPDLYGTVLFPKEEYTTVFDSVMNIEACLAGGLHNVNFQDTFFYAGSDIVVRMTIQNTTDQPGSAGTPVRSFTAANGKGSIFHDGDQAFMNSDFFVNPATDGFATPHVPQAIFQAHKNMPLVYDAGISSIAFPNYDHSCQAGVDSVVVWLKNYGVASMQAIQISYRIDNGTIAHYDWSGNLAGGDSVRVRVALNQAFQVGFHSLTAWVEDSLTSLSHRYRDHEPYNDTAYTNFVACDGPYSGVRTVGGPNANFSTLEQCLYALSRCGVNGPLTIKLASGTYAPVVIPTIPGASAVNYVQFEPQSGTVMFRATRPGNSLVDLQDAKFIRFKNIKFAKQWDNSLTYMVRLGHNSTGCQLLNCQLLDSSRVVSGHGGTPVTASVYSGAADSLVIDGCTFVGGNRAIDITGLALDNRALANKVLRCNFTDAVANAIFVSNQTAVEIDSNTINNVTSNSSYLILMQYCYGGSRVTRNSLFTSHGASAMGVSNVFGLGTDMAVIANNMVVANDDGQSNQMTSPMNLINMKKVKVVYNSVKMTAPDREGIAAVTFGSVQLDSCMFINNIVSCFDNSNFALNYLPMGSTTNVIGHNIYYSTSGSLNRYQSTMCYNLNDWRQLVPMDTTSFELNPYFMNSTPTDLRTYNRTVRGAALPVPEVTDDIYGTSRNVTEPCVGAFEFGALTYDFEVEALEEPVAEYCGAPATIPLRVKIKNSGVSQFIPGTSGQVTISYMTGNQMGSVNVTDTLPADGSHVFNTGRTLSLPSNGIHDTTYTIRVIVRSTIDPNTTNDTSFFTVLSRYQESAPTSFDTTVGYGSSPLVTVHNGVNTWNKFVFNNAPKAPSKLYWFTDSLQGEPFYYGPSLQLEPTYHDTTFFVAQKRDMGLVRITEVQVAKNQPGVTNPYPSWMNATNSFLAVQISNVGDQPKNLSGDTVLIASSESSLNNKRWILPNIVLEPGQSLVLQYRAPAASLDSTRTIYTPQGNSMALAPATNKNFGIIYYDGNGIADAVAFNNEHTHASWTQLNVPNYVWKGAGISWTTNSTAGFYRNSWPSNPNANANAYPNSRDLWATATNNNPMQLGSLRQNLVQYVDNGCFGPRAHVGVVMNMHPPIDIALSEPVVNEGCGLGDEPISLTVHNYGAQPCSTFVLHYQSDTILCSDTISTLLPSQGVMTHTFSTLLPMARRNDTTFNILCWVDAVVGDIVRPNDTSRTSALSLYTPPAPQIDSTDTTGYGHNLHWTLPYTADYIPVWFDRDTTVIDSTFDFVTPYIYVNDTFYVGYVAAVPQDVTVGTGTSHNGNTSYPSPLNGNKRYVKEQYLFSAAELAAAGLQAGPITALSFYLDSVLYAATGNVVFTDYTVSIGSTVNATFASTTDWRSGLTQVYDDELTVSNQHKGWQRLAFSTPYIWDGTSNLAVQVCFTRDGTTAHNAWTRYTTVANTTLIKSNDTQEQCALTTTGTKGGNRPNVLFENAIYSGCMGPLQPIYVTVDSIPAIDGGMAWVEGSGSGIPTPYNSCDPVNLKVRVFNYGRQAITNYTLSYQIDNGSAQTRTITDSLFSNNDTILQLMSQVLTPGRHKIRAIFSVEGDTIHTNDTLNYSLRVRFCGGHYSVGGTTADYPSVAVAIDTLNYAGVDGAVFFDINSGTYNDQLVINPILGASSTNTVCFRSLTGVPSDVVLTYTPTNAANYVVKINGAGYVNFDSLTIYGNYTTGSNNNIFANALVINGGHNLIFDGNRIASKATTASSTNASAILASGLLDSIAFCNNMIDSGYYSLKVVADEESRRLIIVNNTINKFWFMGINVRDMKDVTIQQNTVTGGMHVNKPLTGIWVANNSEGISIERNSVSLVDNFAGVKKALVLTNVRGSSTKKGAIYNNMLSVYGGSASSVNSGCIVVDSSSQMLNIIFNSADLKAGNNAATSKTINITNTCLNLYLMNNIFANHGQGYAYYVTNAGSVVTSNNNDYFTNSIAAVPKLAYWGADASTLANLRAINHADANSHDIQPYFNSEYDLHLRVGNVAAMAQPITDVLTDIDGTPRQPIPGPTIGAHEFYSPTHDIAIVEIREPALLVATQLGRNYIEGDTFYVKVKFMNNGLSTEQNVSWYAELDGVPNTRTITRVIPLMAPQQEIIDSLPIAPPLGVIDTQKVCVYVNCSTDTILGNNTVCEDMFLDPAFNFKAVSITVPEEKCRRYDNVITINVQNVGKKPLPSGMPFSIGYEFRLVTPANVNIPTLPLIHEEFYQLTSDLPVGSSRDLTFATPANLYPTDTFVDITVKGRGWVSYPYDQKPDNDTTAKWSASWKTLQSYATPATPVGEDLSVDYGHWGTVNASQLQNLKIKWYRDSTMAPFYEPNNYNASCHWNLPEPHFYDSVYYLNCFSSKNCASYFGEVHVYINPRIGKDLAPLAILQPQRQKVYDEEDTVQVRIVNYGFETVSNFPVVYELTRVQGNNRTVLQTVTETCHLSLAQDSSGVFTFDSLLQIPDEYRNQDGNYSLRVWTNLSSDGNHSNDTVMTPYTFETKAETYYNTPTVDSIKGLDIVRVTYNSLENLVSEVGFTYTNFGLYDPSARVVPALHVTRGTTDSMTVEVANNTNSSDYLSVGRLQVLIDYNRDGVWSPDEMVDNVVVRSRRPHSFLLTIPNNAEFGYMKMRVMVNMDTARTTEPFTEMTYGNVQDYLVYVDEVVPQVDVALTRIQSPRDYRVDSTGYEITFMMANKGQNAVSSAEINYSYFGDNGNESGSFTWTGNLAPGRSTPVSLPVYHFVEGTTNVQIQVNVAGDADFSNNTLAYQYHRFHVLKLIVEDLFDDDLNKWYAPQGKCPYNKNWWQKGTPNKINIQGAYSEPNAWVTDTVNTVVTGKAGTKSYLYSPIIDIIQIRPDTISFMLSKNMLAGSHLTVEYRNYVDRWVPLTTDSATAWYDDPDGFTGNTPNNAYVNYKFSMKPLSGMFHQLFQLRLVYTAKPGSSDATSYGDGCAVDNFYIGRAQRSKDLGVTQFVHPTAPRFGDIINPVVTIKNYGYDTARMVQLAYRPYGSNIAVPGVYQGAIPPNGGTVNYTFETPFSITNDYPDTFQMCSYTITDGDIYWENDSACAFFALAPLDTDLAVQRFVSPLDHVVAGDSIEVRVRIRNFGLNPMDSIRLSYVLNEDQPVTEHLVFNPPLPSMEYYEYSFKRKFRATVGQMGIMAYGYMNHDNYRFNDTITKTFHGIQAVTDLKADEVIIDTGNYANGGVVILKIQNVGSRAVNNFEVGYWYDRDTNTIFRETFHTETPIPALDSCFHAFTQPLPRRGARYENVTAFLHVIGDNDNSNDTTSKLGTPYIDLEAVRLEIAEDSDAYCSVRLAIKNVGNVILDRPWQKYTLKVTFNESISHTNGIIITSSKNITDSSNRAIAPGSTIHVDFREKIARQPYQTGSLREDGYKRIIKESSVTCFADRNTSNNKTKEVKIFNHFEGIPTVSTGSGLTLEQNFPNPFHNQTNIRFHQPNPGTVRFFVMDMTGKIVYQTTQFYDQGDHLMSFSNDILSTGVYFYGIQSGNERQMRKMVIR